MINLLATIDLSVVTDALNDTGSEYLLFVLAMFPGAIAVGALMWASKSLWTFFKALANGRSYGDQQASDDNDDMNRMGL